MDNRKFGALSSSINPDQLSATVSGVILALSGFIIWGAGQLNIPITNTNIGIFASQLGIAVGALWTLYGLLRKGTIVVAGRLRK
jgi:hypothetical protein